MDSCVLILKRICLDFCLDSIRCWYIYMTVCDQSGYGDLNLVSASLPVCDGYSYEAVALFSRHLAPERRAFDLVRLWALCEGRLSTERLLNFPKAETLRIPDEPIINRS